MSDDRTDDQGAEPVLVSRDGPVLTLTLNRPQRKNALSADMVHTITDAVEGAGSDDVTRVVVLRAVGDDFCSGIDLVQSNRRDEGPTSDPGRTKPRAGHLQRSFHVGAHRMIEVLDGVQVPVVAGVRGWAAGIGNMLALSADVVIATPSARFWVPFVTKGFTPDSGNTWLLPRLVGLARAKEMVLRGKPVPGERAAAWGLVSECVAEEELESAVAAVVEELAGAATVSVGLAKTLLHRNLEVGLTAALQNEGIYEELAVRSDDFKEGMRAFAEKRPPSYTGW
ncbi:MAG: enoyl-CoA hydratase/isomerase family protein [Acidimicrobiales bacterium]